jgi:hypothetical protein
VKQRGFFSLQIWLLIGGAAAIVAAVAWYSLLLIKYGEDRSDAKHMAANLKARGERTELISGLALELAKRTEELTKERLANERRLAEERKKREGLLNAYVPKGSACIRLGFVRYTDAAAAGVPLDAGPGPGVAEAPAGIGTDVVAGIVGRNYDKYHDCKASVAGALKDFDTKRNAHNETVNKINQRVKDNQ